MAAIIQDPALLREFVIESEELLQRVDQDLVALESSPTNQDLLDRIFRAWHTIKGTAGFLGLEPVVQVGHRAEDVLTSLRRGQLQLSQRIMDALLAGRDQLGKMLSDIRAGGLKQYSLDALLTELQQVQLAPANAAVEPVESVTPVAAAKSANVTAEPAPVSSEIPRNENLPRRTAEQPEQKARDAQALMTQTMRVDVRKVDELVNLIGELVLERNRLLQLAKEISAGYSDARGADSPLSHSVARLSFITEELQSAGLRTRMVPIETVFSRFPRLIRDIARSLQKEVDLEIQGEETEIDKTMVELIADPLVHLVRNSLDHGIEAPDERERAHKPRRGKIRLQAKPAGDHILITVSDDGAGIHPDRILRRAIEKGMVSAERGATLRTREILEFVFHPGFSTIENPTNLSGRGVGMDVVRSNVKTMNGSIELDSKPGEGTTVQLHLPPTLAILPVLLVQVGEEIYALPLRSIIETSRFTAANVHQLEGREVVCLRSETLPLLRLQVLFSIAEEKDASQEKKIVVMAIGDARIALLVDRLLGQESTVVKPIIRSLNHSQEIAGSTVGGDGRVRLVINPAGLLTSASKFSRRAARQ